MEIHFNDCFGKYDIINSPTLRRAYMKECMEEAKSMYCKKIKMVCYVKNGEVIKKIPCPEVTKKKEQEACGQ